MKRLILTAAIAVALSASAEPYKIIVPTDPDDEGAIARLVNYDSGETVDSVLVGEQAAVFSGNVDGSYAARVMIDGRRYPVFIVESGTISFSNNDGNPFGTMLNDQLRSFNNAEAELAQQFRAASTDQDQQAILDRYESLRTDLMTANQDNALGYIMFLNGDITQLSAADLQALLAQYPTFASYQRPQRYIAFAQKREATQPGGTFLDFEITYNGRTDRLSDYVGKGKYVLVDFWASWCGPCLRQLPVLKELYAQWHDKGLDVLGVAVWDEPEATERAIVSHELPWPCIIDAQSIPTDLYGIAGIPCIILFGPDGVIISRDKQGDELKAEVNAAMEAATR